MRIHFSGQRLMNLLPSTIIIPKMLHLKCQFENLLHSVHYTLHLHLQILLHLAIYTSYYTLNTVRCTLHAHHMFILYFANVSLLTSNIYESPSHYGLAICIGFVPYQPLFNIDIWTVGYWTLYKGFLIKLLQLL